MKFLAEYSPSEQSALRNEICAEANDDQINYFLRVCTARGVDPFSGLLYMQRRMSKGKYKCSVSPTVDGSRAAASRTGLYAGSDEPEFDSETGDHPEWCRVSVYRMVKDERCAFTAKCRWKEFVPAAPQDFQWKSKPYHMLAKVTEVQALRKAFPESVPATGEDDYDTEADTTQAATPDPEKARVAIEWANAVRAFIPLKKTEADMLAYLKVEKDKLNADHMEALRLYYEELTRE